MLKPREEEFSVSAIPQTMPSARWYCVTVKPNWTSTVEKALYALGHRTFTPKARRWTSHARRKAVVERPIPGMGGYLFVEIDYPRQSFAQVLDTRGVTGFVSTGGAPQPFSRHTERIDMATGEVTETRINPIVDFLIRQLRGEWDEVATMLLPPVGAKVMVVEGPHDGKTAVVTRAQGKKIFAKVEGQAQVSTFFASSLRAA
jgi:transcription antitermination factor NusG